MTPREIDTQVAEKVMGCHVKYYENALPPYQQVPECGCQPRRHGDVLNLPSYNTDIAAAWDILERLQFLPWTICIVAEYGTWACEIYDKPSNQVGNVLGEAKAPTAPMAICLAALKAVGVEVPA